MEKGKEERIRELVKEARKFQQMLANCLDSRHGDANDYCDEVLYILDEMNEVLGEVEEE